MSESETRKREDGGVRERECMNGRSACNTVDREIFTVKNFSPVA